MRYTNAQSVDMKSQGKTPLGRFRHRWEDNIRMNLEGISCILISGGLL
jgi:hypothetical protein